MISEAFGGTCREGLGRGKEAVIASLNQVQHVHASVAIPFDDSHDQTEVRFSQANTLLVRFLAEDRGSWYEVLPCPTDKGMAYIREQMRVREAQQKKIAQLASELKDPLLAELKSLVKEQRIIDAMKKYQAATGADLTTSRMVVKVLEQQR